MGSKHTLILTSVITFLFKFSVKDSIMQLSRKEIISILLCIAAVLSILNAAVFANIMPLHVSYEQMLHQVVCVGTAFSCLLHAASIYLYHSNYSRTRQHMRFVLITVLVILAIANSVTISFYMEYTSYKKLKKSTNVSTLFTTFDMGCSPACLALTIVIILLMVAVMVLVIMTIIRKMRRNRRNGKTWLHMK
ncbi:uncharacterized protein LOC6500368 isoform X1 [Drosophila ananassae]|nr:uncharacterized protein LOC6500368 isoform X1 [Drosophila ananassae]